MREKSLYGGPLLSGRQHSSTASFGRPLVLAIATLMCLGSCDCGTRTTRGPERIISLQSVGDLGLELMAQVEHHHRARFHGEGKWGFSKDPREDWIPVVELRVRGQQGAGVAVAELRGNSAADEKAAQRVVDELTVDQCAHSSGQALVFRIASSADAFATQPAPLTVGDWRAAYVLPRTGALSRQRVPTAAAPTCQS